ncbi:very short patch repair endonuclease [Pseudomonas fluorescens]|uniref:very short patch repair endonuclease n=1 Tax=Pseudomonas fluorescens TaxID=294 RepID=UPI0012429603|nr:very short patch repair endonuclease [Pseudomonas fluorescens]
MDTVSKETRSRMMSRIVGKNTRPELKTRKLLHAQGFRFRLHVKALAGQPDIVLAKYKACIFVQGCFWHRHEGCQYATMPTTRVEFWTEKFRHNVLRDARNRELLIAAGWRVFEVWECSLKGAHPNLDWLYQAIRQSRDNLPPET